MITTIAIMATFWIAWWFYRQVKGKYYKRLLIVIMLLELAVTGYIVSLQAGYIVGYITQLAMLVSVWLIGKSPSKPDTRLRYVGIDSNIHTGHSVCNSCGKDMPKVWDVVCKGCGRTFCYNCSDSSLGYWYCYQCGNDAVKKVISAKQEYAREPGFRSMLIGRWS